MRSYVYDLEEEYPYERWTVIRVSLINRDTDWFRICTLEEIAEIVALEGECMNKAHSTATCVDFAKVADAMERLRFPAQMKGGRVKRMEIVYRPAFLGWSIARNIAKVHQTRRRKMGRVEWDTTRSSSRTR
jgi:hypothetical protein